MAIEYPQSINVALLMALGARHGTTLGAQQAFITLADDLLPKWGTSKVSRRKSTRVL